MGADVLNWKGLCNVKGGVLLKPFFTHLNCESKMASPMAMLLGGTMASIGFP